MTRIQLRDYPTDEELSRLYARPHDHTRYPPDHELRVAVTIQIGRWIGPHTSIADLSCGNGTILNGIAAGQIGRSLAQPNMYLGDFASGYPYHGPLEQTIHEIPDVDLFVCSETIEHVRDPDAVLKMIRMKSQKLLLSTPIGETTPALSPGGNPEHVWGWGIEDVEKMLRTAGWTWKVLNRLEMVDYVYDFQIWACS